MMSSDSDQTVLGSLLKEFRSGTQSTNLQRRPSLYVTPTITQGNQSVNKRSYLDISAPQSVSTSKRARDEDEDEDIASNSMTPTKSKYDSSQLVPGSPWEVRRLRGDLVVARAEVAALERQMKSLHSLREVAEVAFKKEKDILYEQLESEREKTRALKKHNDELRLRESDSRKDLDEVKQELSAVRTKLELQILEFRKENTNLKDKLMEVERTCDQKVKEARSQFAESETQLSYAKKQVETLAKHVKDRDAEIGKLIEENRVLDQNYRALEGADIRAQRMERELQEIRSAKEEVLSKQEKLRNYVSMEEDNRLLRAKNKELHGLLHGKLLLEEQVNSLRDELQGVDEAACAAARHAQENARLRAALDACRELALEPAQGGSGSGPEGGNYEAVPALLRRRLEALWDKHRAAVDEKLETVQNWRESERKLDRLSGELEKATKQGEKLQATYDQQATLVRRLQKKLLLISRERDSYRQQLDIFERDLTIAPQTTQQKETASRIESQERTISMYREMVEKLEEEVNRLQSSADAGKWEQRLRKAEAERNALVAERDRQVKRRKEVESQLDAWAERAFRGDEQSRLLTIGLKDNPVRWAIARRATELGDLKKECKMLRARVRLLEQGDQEVTRNLEDQQQVEKELMDLRDEVKKNEVKMMRLKEAFRNTSQEYREAVYMLTGYTVDREEPQEYKLISVYAESPSDYLMFKNTQGSLDLLETPFSRTLKDMIDFHLKEQASIPMFLSGLTAHLFHKQSLSSTVVDKDTMSLCSMAE
ncbi:mitotic spindle assembly checkpoint protein MAD1 isoform X2 [Bacillus rossius redtenbacheri]|uniref:mitotic spindle assembly checkpoint protein MAD1 isoform X2 n=1 Tax=Bacillus rossius redtenbacheri TaxID=93214 RepID=UPI002FDE76A6